MTDLVDARGVIIEPGDKVIYGFGVGQSVAMAEGEVVKETNHLDNHEFEDCPGCQGADFKVSLTASGQVRVRIIRRSYGGGTKPTVDVMPSRLVVLKPDGAPDNACTDWLLPPSPLPTQEEAKAVERRRLLVVYRERLADDTHPSWANSLEEYHRWCREMIAELEAEEH